MTALLNAINKNNRSLVEQLIQNGADVDELDANQDAPLVIAAYKGYNEIVKLLLEAGADVRAVDPGMKATALHAAAYAGRTEAAKLLIEYNIDINKQGPYNGYTALHDAIWQDNVDIVKLLLEAKAKPEFEIHHAENPLHVAVNNDDLIITQLLLDAGMRANTINLALNMAISSCIFLIEDANYKMGDTDDNRDLTARLPIMHVLLQHGALIPKNFACFVINILKSCDQRDSNVLYILERLSEQYEDATDKIGLEIAQYRRQLTSVTAVAHDGVVKAMNPIAQSVVPKVLCDIVNSYDVPLEHRMRFFRYNELFPVEVKHEVIPEKTKDKCAVM